MCIALVYLCTNCVVRNTPMTYTYIHKCARARTHNTILLFVFANVYIYANNRRDRSCIGSDFVNWILALTHRRMENIPIWRARQQTLYRTSQCWCMICRAHCMRLSCSTYTFVHIHTSISCSVLACVHAYSWNPKYYVRVSAVSPLRTSVCVCVFVHCFWLGENQSG